MNGAEGREAAGLGRRDPRMTVLVAFTVAALVGVAAALVSQVGRSYPGFFFSPDYRVFPVSAESRTAGFAFGDRIVSVAGGSPLLLMTRMETATPVTYQIERGERRVTVALTPERFTRVQ